MINKTSLKFIGGFVLIVVLVLAVLYFLNYYFSPEQKALRYYADLEKQYANDTYGGQTPEETLQLFIDALKAGDIELASKYFVVEKQGEWLQKLQVTKEKNGLTDFVKLIGESKIKSLDSNSAIFNYEIESGGGSVNVGGKEFSVPSGVYTQTISFSKNENSVWKIIDM
ncbi:MAG: hypothetical protein HYY55_02175 [Candidatus Niyogibacteria bacterium]|nr:MAG: hypothetical protein HYY55_02175 [Candidatus Niyogibacteria bacterium]